MNGQVVSLADRLKRRRAELGLSQAQAARELDVARTAYRLWEMEAAKPSPDRWRLIARWLGVSVATMLLADDVIDEGEAGVLETAAVDLARGGGDWDRDAADAAGDFFAQDRQVRRSGAVGGHLSDGQERAVGSVLDRLERASGDTESSPWPVAAVAKVLPADPLAPRAARAAMDFAATGVPRARRQDLQLLVSEVITLHLADPVADGRFGEPSDEPIELGITVGRDAVRGEVRRRSPAPLFPIDPEGPHRFAVVVLASIAARWGTDRVGDANVTWFEVDVPSPGTEGGKDVDDEAAAGTPADASATA